MSRSTGYRGPRFEVPAERPAAAAGLRMRLARKRNEAIGKSKVLPVFRPDFVADQPTTTTKGGRS